MNVVILDVPTEQRARVVGQLVELRAKRLRLSLEVTAGLVRKAKAMVRSRRSAASTLAYIYRLARPGTRPVIAPE